MFTRSRYLFFSLLLFSILLMTYQVKRGPINPLSFLSYPFNAASNLFTQTLSVLKAPIDMMRMAMKENRELKGRIARLAGDLQDYREIKRENERLRRLLGLRSSAPGYIATASVVSRGADQWIKTMVLDKGSADGVEKDMIVITPEGLTGKIVRVWPSYSEMLLLTDSSFSVSVRLQDSRVEGVVTGSGGDSCILKYISNDLDVKTGETVVTSGLDAFYPKGIPVGEVVSARKTAPELFQHITIQPFVDDRRIEEVVIIKR